MVDVPRALTCIIFGHNIDRLGFVVWCAAALLAVPHDYMRAKHQRIHIFCKHDINEPIGAHPSELGFGFCGRCPVRKPKVVEERCKLRLYRVHACPDEQITFLTRACPSVKYKYWRDWHRKQTRKAEEERA